MSTTSTLEPQDNKPTATGKSASIGQPCGMSRISPQSPSPGANTDHAAGEPKLLRPLSRREGTTLDERAVTNDGTARSVRNTIHGFREYVKDSRDTASVFERNGQTISVPTKHRFSEDYADKRYAQLMEVDKTLLEEYTDPHTVGITLTASPFNDEGGWRCPVDHLEDLTASNANVTSALRYALRDRHSAYLSVIGGHENGYPHIHIVAWVDGPVDREDFHSVIDAHTKHCPIASKDHHEYDKAITVESARSLKRRDGCQNSPLATYLGGHLVGIDGSVLDADESEQFFAATLWASNKRAWKPSQSFNDILSDGEETKSAEDTWEFVGMEVGGEVHDVDPDATGGKNMVAIRGLPPDVDPVG